MMKRFFLILTCLITSLTANCADTSAILGSVKFVGNAPSMEKLKISADPYCARLHAGNPPVRQEVVVNRNATLANVIVYVKEGLPSGRSYPAPAEPAVLDQRGCMYLPHVLTLRTGQDLKILNSDPTVHNINAQAKVNPKILFSMISNKVPPQLRKFAKAELPVKIKCDVHPWMLAWAGIFDHPYHQVTGDDGTFSLTGLPAGEYTVEAWHEKYGIQQQKIKVGDGQSQQVEFSYAEGSAGPAVNR